ncbi:unnamed protein product [Linum trigynum]|uniref:Uncharacterized protein n=1 Tax=Linum trigynum TaxID=586398 RepID=A0AAV2CWC7_9ROSI
MVVVSTQQQAHDDDSSANYDRAVELTAFDETKAGVKGLADAGITEVPRIFHIPPHLVDRRPTIPLVDAPTRFRFPTIDLQAAD